MKHIHTFENFLNEKRYEEGLYLPAEPAADTLKSLMKGDELENEVSALDSAVKSINRYNRFVKVNSILDMNLSWASDNQPKGFWDMPGPLIKKGSPNVGIEFWDSYQIGRFNGVPAILLNKDSGAEYKCYVLTVPVN